MASHSTPPVARMATTGTAAERPTTSLPLCQSPPTSVGLGDASENRWASRTSFKWRARPISSC